MINSFEFVVDFFEEDSKVAVSRLVAMVLEEASVGNTLKLVLKVLVFNATLVVMVVPRLLVVAELNSVLLIDGDEEPLVGDNSVISARG